MILMDMLGPAATRVLCRLFKQWAGHALPQPHRQKPFDTNVFWAANVWLSHLCTYCSSASAGMSRNSAPLNTGWLPSSNTIITRTPTVHMQLIASGLWFEPCELSSQFLLFLPVLMFYFTQLRLHLHLHKYMYIYLWRGRPCPWPCLLGPWSLSWLISQMHSLNVNASVLQRAEIPRDKITKRFDYWVASCMLG